jgi:hypothetical protein
VAVLAHLSAAAITGLRRCGLRLIDYGQNIGLWSNAHQHLLPQYLQD